MLNNKVKNDEGQNDFVIGIFVGIMLAVVVAAIGFVIKYSIM